MSNFSISDLMEELSMEVDAYLKKYFKQRKPNTEAETELRASMEYSLFNGGKRFRPVLSLMVADLMLRPRSDVLGFAAAVEMVHTYSLIHDDLPCIDNDDERRGQPTNHIRFGENTALLAGDALLTEAFRCLAEAYENRPAIALSLVRELSRSAGESGMIGGQCIDLKAQQHQVTLETLELMHQKKTGQLIRVAVRGAALASECNPEQVQMLTEFGEHLGLAFQIADDLLDHEDGQPELGSYPGILGVEATRERLALESRAARCKLEIFGEKARNFHQLIEFNAHREV